ncbi:unnamed protein product [Allacma fusca]|uniref:Uncharacterized protein n=1 Tax=Allacma fusca TaxID=39272 RepID=A0A8J2JQ42_9HEXA|nr:unnamed protein product [Allacma fusca]
MDRNPEFSKKYCEKMQDFLDKGYARKLSPAELKIRSPKLWYLPHFAHFNPNKPNKLRLILDAATKSNGTSLNDNLLTGPDLYVPLISVLFKFRQRRFGFGGDIQEMFPQTRIIEDDLPAQRFLWRGTDRSRPADEIEFPDAVAAVVNQHYMDDYFDSTDTVEQAVRKIHSIILIHSKVGWKICNWTSCSTDVLKGIRSDLQCIEDKELSPESELPTERVLVLDEFGVMRVKGRIREATELSSWTKNPVILDRKHPYTVLLGRWYHEQANHYGMETVANNI